MGLAILRGVENDDRVLVPAVLRGVAFALLAGAAVAVWDGLTSSWGSWLTLDRALQAGALGAVLAVTSAVELLARRSPPSRSRDALAVAIAALLALAVSFLATVQADYTYFIIFELSPGNALLSVERYLAGAWAYPVATLYLQSIAVAPFLPALFLRLRDQGVGRQLGGNLLGSFLIALRGIVFEAQCGSDMVYVVGALAIAALVEPVACAVASRLSRRKT